MASASGAELEVEPDSSRDRSAQIYRFAQIGRCVSSVTHDVNNYLGAIMAYAELVAMDSNLSPESNRMLSEVIGAVRKSSALVNNLTDVARKERLDVRIVDPSTLMERVLDLRRYDMKVGHVTLATEYAPDLVNIAVDLPKVQLAFMYLISNAIEALEETKVKRLDVRVGLADGVVEFVFKDSAPAIPSDIAERMFDPYFTTKAKEHLGLGLTLARATIEDHDGELSYTPDRGFLVRIPLNNHYSQPA